MNNEIIAYQRAILAGLLIDSFDADENNERYEVIKDILEDYSHLFSKTQISILKKAKKEIENIRAEGCYEGWIISEAFIEILSENEKDEMIEILDTGALIVSSVKHYLKILNQKLLLRRIYE